MRIAFVYMMSNKSHRLYVGSTIDLLRRVREHKTKHFPNGFTARYIFDRLVWFEVHPDEAAARAKERAVKKWPRARKVMAIQRGNPNWHDLTARLDWSAFLA